MLVLYKGMARAGYALPPRVVGDQQGEILVTIDKILWHQELHSQKHGFRPIRKDGISCARMVQIPFVCSCRWVVSSCSVPG